MSSRKAYQVALYDYKKLMFDGKLEVCYHKDMLFSVPGTPTFPARGPMSYWHLRSYYAKYADDYSVMKYHPLQLMEIDIDEDEPMILYDWIKEIDGSIPDSVEPSSSIEAKEARLIAKIAKKAAKTLQQIKKHYILCPEEHREHYKTMVRAHNDLSKIADNLHVA